MIKIYRFFKLSWCYFIAVLYYIPQASFCHKTSHIMVYVMYYIIAYLTTILWMHLEWLTSWNPPFPPPPPDPSLKYYARVMCQCVLNLFQTMLDFHLISILLIFLFPTCIIYVLHYHTVCCVQMACVSTQGIDCCC